MASAIDWSKPIFGSPTTESVRLNFQIASNEIGDLQDVTANAPFLSLNGGTMIGPLLLARHPTAAMEAATKQYADQATAGVQSFQGRTGAVTLQASDLNTFGLAPLAAPAFTGIPTAPTAAPGNSTTQIATTAFVEEAMVVAAGGGVLSFNGRTGNVTLSPSDLTSAVGGPFVSVSGSSMTGTLSLSGDPTGPFEAATKQYVDNQIGGGGVTSFEGRTGAVALAAFDLDQFDLAPLLSPALTGIPTAPTPLAGSVSTQIATTEFVADAVSAGSGVRSFNGRSGTVTLSLADVTGFGFATLASPALVGSPTAPTAAAGDSSTQIATTEFVQDALTQLGDVEFLRLETAGGTGWWTLADGSKLSHAADTFCIDNSNTGQSVFAVDAVGNGTLTGLTLSNTSKAVNGTIRYNGTRLQVYTGGSWQNILLQND